MKLMPCPLNGLRNISEFVYGGEVTEMPSAVTSSDVAWADYVFMENNVADVVREWWLHVTSGYWFIAERHTATDEIVCTYPASELFNVRVEFEPLPDESTGQGGAE
jgi:sarcosine oxidase subunit delta